MSVLGDLLVPDWLNRQADEHTNAHANESESDEFRSKVVHFSEDDGERLES